MALDVATLPLILYRIRYITIEYYIAKTSMTYTFLPCFLTLPFLLHFFHFQCFFYFSLVIIYITAKPCIPQCSDKLYIIATNEW